MRSAVVSRDVASLAPRPARPGEAPVRRPCRGRCGGHGRHRWDAGPRPAGGDRPLRRHGRRRRPVAVAAARGVPAGSGRAGASARSGDRRRRRPGRLQAAARGQPGAARRGAEHVGRGPADHRVDPGRSTRASWTTGTTCWRWPCPARWCAAGCGTPSAGRTRGSRAGAAPRRSTSAGGCGARATAWSSSRARWSRCRTRRRPRSRRACPWSSPRSRRPPLPARR